MGPAGTASPEWCACVGVAGWACGHLMPRASGAFLQAVERFPSVTYTAVDVRGNTYTNAKRRGVNAVTWGVFPSKEVLQPTVVDHESFLAWKVRARVDAVLRCRVTASS